MNPLNVIFSYNRPYLLNNCVRSFHEFGPGGDLLILDDRSDVKEMKALLDKFEQQRIMVHQSVERGEGRHGRLYNNMEQALSFANEKGYDYIFFIQDDMQFMWKDEDFWEKAEKLFTEQKDALHYRPQFEKIIFSHDKKNMFKYQASTDCWLHLKAAFTAVGVFSIKKLSEVKWKFKNTEVENDSYAKYLGVRLYVSATPVLAFVPEPETWRYRKQMGKSIKPRRKYFLKPLSPEKINQLKSNSRRNIIYLEDYCIPWGWKVLSPYMLSTSNRRKYYKNLWRWIKKSRFRCWPKLVGAD